MESLNEYKIDLDIYNGPIDLLLYLIRKEEVNIYDIPISRITNQYLEHVEALKTLEIDVIGDFLVMAATLMYIKSYMLLPRTETLEDEEIEDPRTSLVKQLLEYKKYKESTFILSVRSAEWEKKWSRQTRNITIEAKENSEELPLEGVSLWDLLHRLSLLLKQTLTNIPNTITYDDTPIKDYMSEIVKKVQQNRVISFMGLFEGIHERGRIIGFFLALLELVRLNKIRIEQPSHDTDIQISLHT